MIKVLGEHYYNDLQREPFEKTFLRLDLIFEWMKEVSKNFTNNYGNYFPEASVSIERISCRDEDNPGYRYWIHQIETDDGIVFSDGKYTSGLKHCAAAIKKWCEEGNEKIKKIKTKPQFVEM